MARFCCFLPKNLIDYVKIKFKGIHMFLVFAQANSAIKEGLESFTKVTGPEDLHTLPAYVTNFFRWQVELSGYDYGIIPSVMNSEENEEMRIIPGMEKRETRKQKRLRQLRDMILALGDEFKRLAFIWARNEATAEYLQRIHDAIDAQRKLLKGDDPVSRRARQELDLLENSVHETQAKAANQAKVAAEALEKREVLSRKDLERMEIETEEAEDRARGIGQFFNNVVRDITRNRGHRSATMAAEAMSAARAAEEQRRGRHVEGAFPEEAEIPPSAYAGSDYEVDGDDEYFIDPKTGRKTKRPKKKKKSPFGDIDDYDSDSSWYGHG